MSIQSPDLAIDPTRLLGDLVAERSSRARVFERYGIDYCCHGQRSLAAAATAAGVEISELAAALAEVDPAEDTVAQLGPVELIDHIVSVHHAYLYEELPAITALATKVEQVHGNHHPELVTVARLVREIRADLEPHLEQEEVEVFPAIRHQVASGAAVAQEVIEDLRDEHETVGTLLAELRRTTSDYAVPADACASYQALYGRLADLETDTFRHIHLENNVLFTALNQ